MGNKGLWGNSFTVRCLGFKSVAAVKMLYCLYRKNLPEEPQSLYSSYAQFSRDMPPSHTSPVVNLRTQRTVFSVIKLLKNDAKEGFRDWTFPFNPQLAKHTFTVEYKNIRLFSKRRKMWPNCSHPAYQCNRDRISHKMETASHTFLLGQTHQLQLPSLWPSVRPNRLHRRHLGNFSLILCCAFYCSLKLP